MHGAGNDFVVVDGAQLSIPEDRLPNVALRVCDRHFGVGADGFVLVLPSRTANIRMRIYNPDGTEAEMCGNALRCISKFVFDRRMHTDPVVTIETIPGIQIVKMDTAGGKMHSARVDMGEPRLLRSEIPMKGANTQVVSEPLKVAGKKIEITCVSMGNPHCVTFVDNVDTYPVTTMGPAIENHPSFPQRTNVEFVQILNPREVRQRTWERSVGETLACGSGSSSTLVAGVLNDKLNRKVTVHLTGGDLQIEWSGNNHVYMTGPAEEVFEGEISAAVLKQWAK